MCSEDDVFEINVLVKSSQLTPVIIFKCSQLKRPQKSAGQSYLNNYLIPQLLVKGFLRKKVPVETVDWMNCKSYMILLLLLQTKNIHSRSRSQMASNNSCSALTSFLVLHIFHHSGIWAYLKCLQPWMSFLSSEFFRFAILSCCWKNQSLKILRTFSTCLEDQT